MSNIVHIDDAVSASHLRSSVVDRVPPWLMAYQRCGGQQLHKKIVGIGDPKKRAARTRARFGDVFFSWKHEIWVFWIVITLGLLVLNGCCLRRIPRSARHSNSTMVLLNLTRRSFLPSGDSKWWLQHHQPRISAFPPKIRCMRSKGEDNKALMSSRNKGSQDGELTKKEI